MSKTVDQRVVEMQFDNKHFESNVKNTMSSLDKLKESLNLSGATKGLENVGSAAKNCDMSGLSGAVQTVQAKFSALQVAAITALANIVNSAVDAGKRIVSALTIDPITDGFNEYELKMGSIQTIMAGTGASLEEVNKYLDELNLYADRTIYSFSDMTKNIGKFTNAGVGLKDAVKAIQGISNVAAVSGANAEEASRAMYNFAQALSAGYVKLIDWKSIENANMATVEFKTQLLEAGVAAGTLAKTADGMYKVLTSDNKGSGLDAAISATKNFNDSLSYQWMTTETLVGTLGKYSDETTDIGKKAFAAAQDVKTLSQLFDTLKEAAGSGWAQTWETLIGDFDESKEMLSKASQTFGDIIGNSAKARNDLLSGGLSSGWKQLISQGISDEEAFINTVTTVAKKHGVAIDKMITSEGSFQKTLKNGWLTADVLSESIATLTKKTSGLSDSQLEGLGYTREQISSLEKLNSSVQDGSVSMEEFANRITKASGRENLITALKNAFEGLMSIVKPIKAAFTEIFPPMTAQQLYNITERIKDLTAKFKMSETTAENLKRTFKGVFALFDVGKMAVSALARGFGRLLSFITPAGNGILSFTGGIGDFIVGIRDAIKSADTFNKVIEKIGNVFEFVIGKVKNFVSEIAKAFGGFAKIDTSGMDAFTDRVNTRFAPFTKLAELVKSVISGIGTILKKFAPILYAIVGKVGDGFRELQKAIVYGIENMDFSAVFDIINGGILAAILLAIRKFVSNGAKAFEGIKDVLDGVKGCFEAWQQSLKANTLLKIAGAIGIITVAVIALSMIDSKKLTVALTAVTVMFAELFGSMAIFEKIMGSAGFKAMGKVTRAMLTLSVAILILSFAVTKLAKLDWDGLAKGLTGVAALASILIGASTVISKTSGKLMKGSLGIIAFSTAIVILTKAVEKLGKLSVKALAKGLVGVGVLCTELALFMKATDLNKLGLGKGLGLLLLATAVNILATAVTKFASLDTKAMIRGLTAMTVVLAELVIFTKLTGDAKKVISTAIGLTILGAAMLIFASAIGKMGALSLAEIGKGLLTMAGALGVIIAAMKLMPKGLITKALGLIGLATALVILSHALENMGKMSGAEIAKSLITLAGALTIIVIAMKLMTGALAGAAALLIISTALLSLSVVMIMLGSMKMSEIGKSLLMLAGIFAVFGIAAYALGPVVPVMIGLGAAILLLGVGVAAAGVGILALSIGISALAGAFKASGNAIFTVIKGLIELIPFIIIKVGEGLIGLFDVIGKSGESLFKAFSAIIGAAIKAIVENVPKIVDGLFVILDNVLKNLMTHVPKFVGYIMKMFIEIIRTIAKHLPELISAGMELLLAFVRGVMDALQDLSSDDLAGLVITIGALITIFSLIATLATVMSIAGTAILGLTAILAVLGGIAQIPGLTWLVNEGGKFMGAIGNAIGSFVGGLVGGFASMAANALPGIGKNLSAFMTNAKPFFDGVKGVNESASRGVSALATAILKLTAANILQGLTSWLTGGSSLASFGKELAVFGVYFKKYADSVDGIDGDVIKASADAASVLSKFAAGLPNQGGIISWFTGNNNLAFFAEGLAEFGPAFKKYAKSVEGINPEVVIASANAAKALSEMAANLPNQGGVKSWLEGDNRLSVFAEELAAFGPVLRDYAKSIKNIDPKVVVASANAAKALAALAHNLPDQGGLKSWFKGDNKLSDFAKELAVFGPVLSKYAKGMQGVNPDVIKASANAAKSLAELAHNLPNQGGMVSWFTGDNKLSKFAKGLAAFGPEFKKYAKSIEGIDPSAVKASANAAKSLSELAKNLPNQGGLVSLFTGDNKLSKFANGLAAFGPKMKKYANSVEGIDSSAVKASTNAAKALGEMANHLPNQGGMVSWFTGDNKLSKFADELAVFGPKLKKYADSVKGIDASIVETSANAALTLSEMASKLPSQGGISSWFTGDNKLSKFAEELAAFGPKLKQYSKSIEGVNPSIVESSANAALALAKMANNLPNQGGMVSWFTGDNKLSKFSEELSAFGPKFKKYADSVNGIDSTTVTTSANAAKALAEMAKNLPNQGGLVSLFTGDNKLSKFADELALFGPKLKKYANSIEGIGIDSVQTSANAALTLSQMAENLPKQGGFLSLFSGDNKLSKFADELVNFGPKLKKYANSISGIDPAVATNSANAGKALSKLANSLPDQGGLKALFTGDNTLSKFGTNIEDFGKKFKGYYGQISGINFALLESAVKQIKQLVAIAKDVSTLEVKALSKFGDDLKKLGNTGISGFISAFDGSVSKLKAVGVTLHDKVIEGFNSKKKGFETAGSDAGAGFIKGLKNQNSSASTAGKQLGEAVLKAAKKALDSHSPSKKFEELGEDTDKGFAIGITKYGKMVTDASEDVGLGAIDSMSSVISGIADVINSDIDSSLTIRPVVDMSNVETSADQISNMFNRSNQLDVSATLNKANNSTVSAQLNNDLQGFVKTALDGIKKTLSELEKPAPQIVFEGNYSFRDQNDIDHFMNQAALLVDRRKG